MRNLNEMEVSCASGGVLAEFLGITGIEEGLTVSAIGGALSFAAGIGWAIGTGINYLLPTQWKRAIGDAEAGFIDSML